MWSDFYIYNCKYDIRKNRIAVLIYLENKVIIEELKKKPLKRLLSPLKYTTILQES